MCNWIFWIWMEFEFFLFGCKFCVKMVDKGGDLSEEEDFIIIEDFVVMKYKMVGDMVNCK